MKTITKTIIAGTLVLAAVVGCKKDNVVLIPSDADTVLITDTLPITDTVPVVDTVVIDWPTFDTVPASFDGFDIRGRWLGAPLHVGAPFYYSPNRLLITFRDDSIAVFTSYVYDTQYSLHSCVIASMDSAKYRTVYDSPDSYKKVYFYHCWMTDGTIYRPDFSIYCWGYLLWLYDDQNTMYMNFNQFVTQDADSPCEESFYVVRY